jgi:hypothetical protein
LKFFTLRLSSLLFPAQAKPHKCLVFVRKEASIVSGRRIKRMIVLSLVREKAALGKVVLEDREESGFLAFEIRSAF